MPELAYVSAVIEPTIGTIAKLDSQATACAEADIPIDFYWIGRGSRLQTSTFKRLHLLRVDAANAPQFRRLQATHINSLLERYDHVVLRYPLWDPVFHALLREKHRIVLEMHTINLKELALGRSWRYLTERLAGRWMRGFGGIVGVTPELLEAEVARSGYRGPTAFVPNSIDVSSLSAADSPLFNGSSSMKVVMVASRFYRWHGLEEVLDSMQRAARPAPPFELHLAGELTPEQRRRAADVPGIVQHGMQNADQLRALYAEAQAGLTSFNLADKGMTMATPLKSREYLAAGLPIVGGFFDPALPRDFPYQLTAAAIDPVAIHAFVTSIGTTSRRDIHVAAAPYIDSRAISQRLLDFCRSL